jgi:hypothetical protein
MRLTAGVTDIPGAVTFDWAPALLVDGNACRDGLELAGAADDSKGRCSGKELMVLLSVV